MRPTSIFSYPLLLAVLALAGCSVNPVTGENQFSIMSADQEVAMGQKNYIPSQQSQGGRYVVDPDLTVYVKRVGQKLAAVSDRKQLPYDFVVLNNSVPNAWALPGGKIAINRGLLLELDDEAQLAAVLGHEIVHAAARHGATQMTQQTLLGIGAQVAGIAADRAGYGALGATGAQMGAAAWQAHYGRSQELESDNYGMEYMARAGYEPQAAVELQQTFVRLSQSRQTSWIDGFFASHPPSQQRVDANRAKAAQLPSGERNRAAYQRAIAQIKKDKPAYDALEAGIKAANDKSYDKALSLVNKAAQLQPREPSFWEFKGALLAHKKQNSQALAAYGKAINANPEHYSGYLRRGLLQRQLGKNQAAEQDLERSLRILPTQMASYQLGKLALERGNKGRATGFFQQTAQGGGELGQAAQQELTKLQPAQPANQGQ